MATNVVEEDVEYNSDPEESKRSLTMRRRERASDDEADAIDDNKRQEDDSRVHSDDSDGEGGVADYDDEEEEEELIEQELEEEEEGYEERDVVQEEEGASGDAEVAVKESDGDDVKPSLEGSAEAGNSEEKKENEPFAVPTAGAFYMHDDRFRDNVGGRNRRIQGGRRLWESKDERKWGHDKFEEITLHERHYQEGRRSSKGSYRGRARSRGTDRGGYVQGNRKGYDSSSGTQRYNSNSRNGRYNSSSSNQSQVPKGIVRGRGPRRYEPTNKSNGPAPQVQNRQTGKPHEKSSNGNSERTSAPTSNAESEPVPAKKQMFASNLNIASPPFYPSGSSNKDVNLNQKRDVQSGSTSRNGNFQVQQNSTLLRGKNVVDPISMDKLHIDESVRKPLNNAHMAPLINASQSSHPRAAGRGMAIPVQMNYQPVPSYNQVNAVPSTQPQGGSQRSSAPGQTSASVQSYVPKSGHQSGSGSQSSSPPEASSSNNSFDSGVIDAASESGKSKGELVGKGRGVSQGSGRGSFVYGGAQVMGAAGNVAVSHGDPNFPTFLPVMQFGGQHPGGIGVPAVGMAFPGYVGQPQHGGGSSEMTWLPVLTGAAGALGATYCSPYLAIDGAYNRQSGQTSTMGTASKENNAKKANSELKPSQKSEVLSDEFGQRQNKPRRYSEMNFGQ